MGRANFNHAPDEDAPGVVRAVASGHRGWRRARTISAQAVIVRAAILGLFPLAIAQRLARRIGGHDA
jgi:hypothetical protein